MKEENRMIYGFENQKGTGAQCKLPPWTCLPGPTCEKSAEEYAAVLIPLLKERGMSVACAESCTGGLLCAAIVSVPGASDVFYNGFVTYAEHAKTRFLGVSEETLALHTAVSAETAAEMAAGCARVGEADLALAVTGLAGPDGGTAERPVGLVYISAFYKEEIRVLEYHFPGERQKVREAAAAAALALGLSCLYGEGEKP